MSLAVETLWRAAGATTVYERLPFSSTHNMGTCRMSANARDGVCNRHGQAHDVPIIDDCHVLAWHQEEVRSVQLPALFLDIAAADVPAAMIDAARKPVAA